MTSTAARTPSAGDVPLVHHLLFVCNHNAGRSQMAQAFVERQGPPDMLAESAEEIRACADAVPSGFDDARVHSHVMTLAHRQTRECPRRETCDRITTASPS